MVQDQAHLDPEIVQRAATMATNVATDISGHHQTLGQPVAALAGQWEGRAYQAFVPVYQEWEQGVIRLVNALNALGESTGVAVATYSTTDESRGAGIASVAGHSPFGGALNTA